MEITRRFVATVFVVQNGKVLLTWHKKVQNWIPIGGHLEPNELPGDCAIREAKEESGLDVELKSPHTKSATENLIQPAHIQLDQLKPDLENINFVYFGIVKSGECSKLDEDSKELRWFSKEDLSADGFLPRVKSVAIEALDHLGKLH